MLPANLDFDCRNQIQKQPGFLVGTEVKTVLVVSRPLFLTERVDPQAL